MGLISPPKLTQGDKVALLAPSSYLNDDTPIKEAEVLLQSWGLIPVRGKYIMERQSSYAGTDKQRLKDLQEALDDPEIKAIWMLRGGYGMMRILPEINFKIFKASPKWVAGFSDITALHNAIHNLGIKSLHAAMPQQFYKGLSEDAVETLRKALFGEEYKVKREGCTLEKPGSIKAILTGGNLSLITSLLGTKFKPDYKGKVLFLEEVGEPLYKIDRMLQSLELSGVFEEITGLVIGAFTGKSSDTDKLGHINHYQLFIPIIEKYKFPILFDVPAGHIPDNRTLILGDEVEVNIGEFVSCIRFNNMICV